jgi:hypothetical protein
LQASHRMSCLDSGLNSTTTKPLDNPSTRRRGSASSETVPDPVRLQCDSPGAHSAHECMKTCKVNVECEGACFDVPAAICGRAKEMHFPSVLLLLLLLTSRESSRGLVQAARIGAAPARHFARLNRHTYNHRVLALGRSVFRTYPRSLTQTRLLQFERGHMG